MFLSLSPNPISPFASFFFFFFKVSSQMKSLLALSWEMQLSVKDLWPF